MKCPHCKKEVKGAKEVGVMEGIVLRNWIPVGFTLGMLMWWLLPFDIKHGYSAEWDMVAWLGISLLYIAYLIAYAYGKVKGRFVLMKREV